MNNKILKLAASHFPSDEDGSIFTTPEIIEQFAQSVIQECVGVCEELSDNSWSISEVKHTEQCAQAIKDHFGIE